MAKPSQRKRLAWWQQAKFGMFIHWGLYSVLGRHEWAMAFEAIPPAEYELLARRFRPKPHAARAWARLAKAAGMKYMVMTAKHHEGYCLWDTATTDYCAPKQAAGRDLVAEYVAAARAEGMHVGIYFSLMDWHHPDGLRCATSAAARKRFLAYVHAQVRELCSRYGRLDIFWYDCPKPLATAALWRSAELNAMVRRLQPGILINNRSLRPEDFATPEQKIEAVPGRAWEANMTLNDSWGYHRNDTNWKPAPAVVRNLARCARLGGNHLLNIGPRADGSVPAACVRILKQVGAWLRRNGEAFYGTQPCGIRGTPFSICTQKGNTLYVQCYYWPGERWSTAGLKCRVRSARILGTGRRIDVKQVGCRLKFSGCPVKAPDPITTVIAVECDRPPIQCTWQELYRSLRRPGVNVSFAR